MAKTNWQLNEIVMPADMNQIGTEINEKAPRNNPNFTGSVSFSNQIFFKSLGLKTTINGSPNQKININLPSGYNFNGLFTLEVLGNSSSPTNLGKLTKVFTGVFNGSALTFSGTSKYEEIYSVVRNNNAIYETVQIGEPFNSGSSISIPVSYSATNSNALNFSIKLETSSTSSNVPVFFNGITIGDFYADSVALPKAYEQKDRLELTAPQGTAPLIVTSTTKVDNLNSDSLNGLRYYQSPTEFGVVVGTENEENIALGMVNDSVLIFRKTNANTSSFYPDTPGTLKVIKKGNTGVSFTFTTQKNVSPPVFVRYEASFNNEILTAARWTGWKKVLVEGQSISSSQLISTAPQGTAPLVVASTTRVDNLNPEIWNGWRIYSTYGSLGLPNTSTMQDVLTILPTLSKLVLGISASNREGLLLNEDGTLEVTKLSNTRAKAVFISFSGNVLEAKINNSLIFSGWSSPAINGSPISTTQLTSTASQGTSPLVVTSNTKVNNLNSDLLDDMHADVNKTASTIVARKSDGGVNAGGFSSFEQIGIKLPGRNRELRLTQDANNISYIQLVNDSGGFISNPIQINADGTAGFNVSTNVISYTNPATPQVRNTHVGNSAPSNSLGINGDIYIEL